MQAGPTGSLAIMQLQNDELAAYYDYKGLHIANTTDPAEVRREYASAMQCLLLLLLLLGVAKLPLFHQWCRMKGVHDY
jgi:hypothetical protein